MAPKKTKDTKKRTCCFEDVAGPTLVQLLRIAPQNPTSRAQLLARIKVPVPDDITSYEGIVDWVESNIKSGSEVDLSQPAFTFGCDFSKTDRVRCILGVDRYLSFPGMMTIREVLEEAREFLRCCAEDGELPQWRDFTNRVMDKLTEEAQTALDAQLTQNWTTPGSFEEVEVVQAAERDAIACNITGSISDYLYNTLTTYGRELRDQIDK